MKGQYILVMILEKDSRIRIGMKGFHNFRKGCYAYVGSALNSIEKRIERHNRRKKKKHWHIDYFLEKARIVETKTFRSMVKENECRLSRKVERSGGKVIMKGFGSSDCSCASHLYFLGDEYCKLLIT